MNWARWESGGFYFLLTVSFLAVAGWETIAPARHAVFSTARRWRNHFLLFFFANAASILLLRASPLAAAAWAADRDWGLLHVLNAPAWVAWPAAFLAMDFMRYITHRLLHAFDWSWRIHAVHHADPEFDVSTALRAHPAEVLITQAGTLSAVLLMGLDPMAVLAVEMVATAQSFFEHANASLPAKWNQALSWVWITPEFHRRHHSDEERDQRTNYGEIFPWWDRMLGTIAQRTDGVARVGVKGMQDERSVSVGFLLGEPFRKADAQ